MQVRAEDVDLPGVAPSRQQRSRETTAALLRAGAELLRTHSLAKLSIETLCKKVGATVGAFYSRFESKETYFNALIALAARDGDRALAQMKASGAAETPELAKLCALLVRGITGWVRDHEGLLRAALQHGSSRPDGWTPFKNLARGVTRGATPLLLPAMGQGDKAAQTRAIAFGFQVVLGTLVNAILNNPGPVSIRDREMEDRLALCLQYMLQVESVPKSRRRRPQAEPR